ncbi:aminopeptidase [Lunatimonas salinarum]|uniref:aminopeptidase n=1 Tax=Lunatimonas salinarum TaxID=1774590 RepID=UPI001AE05155|nr:aminopeptidase [Lunatimonas salinarum]
MPTHPLLIELLHLSGVSGDERRVRDFVLNYVLKRRKFWKVAPEVHFGDNLQDNLILAFGNPRTAVFAHMDTVGFMARYANQLVPVGGPEVLDGDALIGEDAYGSIACRLLVDDGNLYHDFKRPVLPGTILTYRQDVEITDSYIEGAYLDNRLGVYNALLLCEELTDGLVVFSTYEEHGGGAVPLLMKYIYERWPIQNALISDITWATEGVRPGEGVVISLRDKHIPRRSFLNKMVLLADESEIPYQLEVEAYGSSDGREVHYSPYPVDWCFIGAPQENAHTPRERVIWTDFESMLQLYRFLMDRL